MAFRTFPIISCLAFLPLMSCSSKTAAPTVAAKTPEATIQPSCRIESSQEYKFDENNVLTVWNLKATGLKQFTVRLVLAIDGKVQVAKEEQFKWNEWAPSEKQATGQLMYLLQDGKAFGIKGKRLPQINTDFQGSPAPSKSMNSRNVFLEGEFQGYSGGSASHEESLPKKSEIFYRVFKQNGNVSYTIPFKSREELAAASKDGKAIILIEVEWEPQ